MRQILVCHLLLLLKKKILAWIYYLRTFCVLTLVNAVDKQQRSLIRIGKIYFRMKINSIDKLQIPVLWLWEMKNAFWKFTYTDRRTLVVYWWPGILDNIYNTMNHTSQHIGDGSHHCCLHISGLKVKKNCICRLLYRTQRQSCFNFTSSNILLYRQLKGNIELIYRKCENWDKGRPKTYPEYCLCHTLVQCDPVGVESPRVRPGVSRSLSGDPQGQPGSWDASISAMPLHIISQAVQWLCCAGWNGCMGQLHGSRQYPG